MKGQEQVEEMRCAETAYFCEIAINPTKWEEALAKWKQVKENTLKCNKTWELQND